MASLFDCFFAGADLVMNSNLLLRITAPAVLIGLVLCGACLAGAWYIHRLQTNMTALLTQTVRSVQAAQELEIRVRQLRFHTLVYLTKPTPERLEPVEADQELFQKALEVVRQTATTEAQKACVRDIEQQYAQYKEELAERRAHVEAGLAPQQLTELVNPQKMHIVIDPSQELVRLNRESMDQVAEETRTAGEHANLALLFLGLAGPISGIVMGYGVARGLSRSLYRLSVRVQDMAQHLDRDVGSVSVVADGDLHNLDRQLQTIVHRVEEVAERLQQHQRELIRAEQLSAVGQLAASVAHEVRNPLTGIKMLVESALHSNNSKPLNLEDLQVIHREIARLEQTVQGFLNFARLPAPQRSLCDLRTVVRQAADLVGARARQIKVEVLLHLPDESVSANIDRSQLETVLVNLFINALDAMPRGGRLEVTLTDHADTGARITVADTGCGIPAHIASRLFTPFTTTKPTGTGLGLTISGRILEEHGGSISAGNRPEGGACFVINLPLVSPEAAHADAAGH
jgi:two-component system, NtrC family, sensor histidine kinase HydH